MLLCCIVLLIWLGNESQLQKGLLGCCVSLPKRPARFIDQPQPVNFDEVVGGLTTRDPESTRQGLSGCSRVHFDVLVK